MSIRKVRVEVWHRFKQFAGHLWRRVSRDRAAYWLDYLRAFRSRQRYLAERHNRHVE